MVMQAYIRLYASSTPLPERHLLAGVACILESLLDIDPES
jgi:hypothetical protein